jgi:hypothetical protein
LVRSLARRVVPVLAASLAGAFFATNEPWLASGKAVCEFREPRPSLRSICEDASGPTVLSTGSMIKAFALS